METIFTFTCFSRNVTAEIAFQEPYAFCQSFSTILGVEQVQVRSTENLWNRNLIANHAGKTEQIVERTEGSEPNRRVNLFENTHSVI